MKKYFPLLQNQPDLVYLDNAATTQLPQVVIDRLDHYAKYEHANIHRGLYDLSAANTALYEATRQVVKDFLAADDSYETIFNQGTTFGLNWAAVGLKHLLTDKDAILIGRDSHHSNIVPWQQIAQETRAKLAFIPINDQGQIDRTELARLLPEATVIALSHVSNVTG
ncbi:MAG: aminotransferase class V-fold PLP-dependent enzyme, partial [bacterium]|nr:aminotransferase class V-fold PLP-dependent enzyme [bacterium]